MTRFITSKGKAQEKKRYYDYYVGEGETSVVAPEDSSLAGDLFFQSFIALAANDLEIASKLDKATKEPLPSLGNSVVADMRAFPSTPCARASFKVRSAPSFF